MKRNTLVQIQSATLPVAPGATLAVVPGTLPPSLVDPRRKLYRCAMTAIDLLEEGLKAKDRRIVREAHTIIRETGRKIKKHFCRNYLSRPRSGLAESLERALYFRGIGSVSARSLS